MLTPAVSISPSDAKIRHIPSLDGLRAASISIVLVAHASLLIPWQGPVASRLRVFVNNGHLGVMVFFVISGYLITYLLRREWEKTGGISLRAFYVRRMLRIFPALYAFLAVLTILVIWKVVPLSGTDLTLAGTYTWNYRWFTRPWNPPASAGYYTPQNWYAAHLWSLSLEEQFYLLWPPLLVWIGLRRGQTVALGIILAEPLFRLATHLLCPPLRGNFLVMLPWALDPLMFGAAAALSQGQPFFERMWTRFNNGWIALFAVVFLAIVSPLVERRFTGPYILLLGPSLQSTAILMVLLWLVRRPESRVGRFFNLPAVAATGVLSYSIYLWQQLFLFGGETHPWPVQRLPWNLLGCFAAATGSYLLIEKPFLKWKERFVQTPARSKRVREGATA